MNENLTVENPEKTPEVDIEDIANMAEGMQEPTEKQPTSTTDSDTMMPDGWAEGDDIFASPDTWTGKKAKADESGGEADTKEDEEKQDEESEGSEDETPTTESEEEQTDPDASAEGTEPPTTEEKEPEAPKKLKFTAKFDHENKEVELDESELPTIYQKAQATDRVQAKLEKLQPDLQRLEQLNPLLEKLKALAKVTGFDNEDALVSGALDDFKTEKVKELMEQGTPEVIAKDYVERTVKEAFSSTPAQTAAAAPAPTDTGTAETPAGEPATRDFKAEVKELLDARPELRGQKLPEEVVSAAVRDNKRLIVAYANYAANQTKAELDKLRKENNTLKQNAASAAKAPVRGVAKGGATNTKPEDPFVKGFMSDDWS